jgi:16S rRNA U516 pseudouridylate synthase RsuA-like enzyme
LLQVGLSVMSIRRLRMGEVALRIRPNGTMQQGT